jgi:ribosomal protein L35AE/L33A
MNRPATSILPVGLSRRRTWGTLIGTLGVAIAGFRRSAHAQAVQLVVVDIHAVEQGYRARKLLGTAVENDKNQKVGALEDLVILKDHALFGVLQVGAFLGLGGHLIAVPYESLLISDDGQKITLAGASKDALGKLPEYQAQK